MKKFLLFAGSLLLIVIAMIACGGTDTANTGTTSPNGSTPASTQAAQEHFKVKQTVTVGSTWKVVVNSIKANPGDGQFNVPKNGTYVIVNVSLTNISNAEQNLSSLISFKFKGNDGTVYTETITGALAGVTTSPNGKVAAGDIVKGDLVYDVPTSVKSFTLSFAPDIASSGQTIWDLKL